MSCARTRSEMLRGMSKPAGFPGGGNGYLDVACVNPQ
jgi:hypothetical protein